MEAKPRGRKEENKRVMLPRVGSGAGGGLETLVLWGGALAVAGLIAAFSIKKRRNEEAVDYSTCHNSSQKEEEKRDGLRFVLQSSSPTVSLNPCNASCETPMVGVAEIDNCTTGKLTNMRITEEKHASSGEYQEILLSDPEQESIVISDDGDGDAKEEFSFPVLENTVADGPEKVINVASEAPSVLEAVSVKMEDEYQMTEEDRAEQTSFSSPSLTDEDEEAVTAEEESSEQFPSSTVESEETEEELSMKSQLLGEKEENHSRTDSSLSSSESGECWLNQSASTEEDVTEESTENSEEGGSSTETNEAIWPAEMIDASSAGHRKTIINYQNSGGQRDADTTQVQELLRTIDDNKDAQELVVVVHGGKHLIRWQIALCSVVLPLLLLLLANWIITRKYSI